MVKIKASIVLLVGLVISFMAHANETSTCPGTPYLLRKPAGYDHLRYAPAQMERRYEGGSFTASVDSDDDDNGDGVPDYLVQPTWVATNLKAYRSNRGSNYAPSDRAPVDWYRIRLFNEERKHYKTNKRVDSSYDGMEKIWKRGQLVDRAEANRLGKTYGCNNHVFANALPIKPKLQQGIWLALSNYIASLANQRGELWVVSGPIYEQGGVLETIGDVQRKEIPVAIPDRLFKVVFMENEAGVEVLSFIFPNQYEERPKNYLSGNCQRDQQYDYTPFIVSLYEVEQATGLTFFPYSDIDLDQFKKVSATGLPVIDDKHAVGYCM